MTMIIIKSNRIINYRKYCLERPRPYRQQFKSYSNLKVDKIDAGFHSEYVKYLKMK